MRRLILPIPDKICDRIGGALVDMAYAQKENPKVAGEVLIGHKNCHIIIETDVNYDYEKVCEVVKRITETDDIKVDLQVVPQDEHLAKNQENEVRCGDNGIFKGVPMSIEEENLIDIARGIYNDFKSDGKYIQDIKSESLTICQSYTAEKMEQIKSKYGVNNFEEYVKEQFMTCYNLKCNPLGEWTGGTDVDSGATNRKLGSDMGNSITGGGLHCLSGDSQYLGEDKQWHYIKDYKKGKVAQWNDGKLEFVEPIKYIHNKNEDMIHIYNNTKLSMKMTPKHQVLIKTSKGNLIKKDASIVALKIAKEQGNQGSIIHNFTYSNKVGKSEYKDINDYRLQIAFCADGTILKNGYRLYNGRIRVKNPKKIERLRYLFKGKKYKETKDNEYSIFWAMYPKKSKSLYECFKNEDLKEFVKEIYKWDGDEKDKIFRTTKQEEADFVQYAIATIGKVATITKSKLEGREKIVSGKKYIQTSNLYLVHELKSSQTALRKSKESPIKVDMLKNKEDSFCFEVPSHNLIIRHNKRIFITGNCKDLSKADVSVNIYCFLQAQRLKREVKAMCSIGDTDVYVEIGETNYMIPFKEVVAIAKNYIDGLGGFEKFAEWGLIR